jgi:hypothetical protein
MRGIDIVPPLQGLKFCCHETRGVALGCHVVALSAREEADTNVFNRTKIPDQSNLFL